MKPSAYLLDIEGTTTPIDFVTKVLFPFARLEMSNFIANSLNNTESRLSMVADCCLLADEWKQDTSPPAWDDCPDPRSALPYLYWLMDHDRKSTALKSIQGRIWEQGYLSGKIQGKVYDDVWPAVERWHSRGAQIYIYSSGSTLAQKLLFGHLAKGDMTKFIAGYFDTTTGPKRDSNSYTKISSVIGQPPEEICFLSDIIQEVQAARAAGINSLLVDRTGENSEAIPNFDSLE